MSITILHITNLPASTGANNPPDTGKPVFRFLVEQFSDLKIMKYTLDGFDQLSLNKKLLVYYLYQAALCGRDITWDQNYRHNLLVRKTLDHIMMNYKGDRNAEEFKNFTVYTKRVWFSNGIHHHYSSDKILPAFSKDYFSELVRSCWGKFPAEKDESPDDFIKRLIPIIFDPSVDGKKICLDPTKDMIQASATNFYEGVTQQEAEDFYKKLTNPNDAQPVWWGLNSKLLKEDGIIKEKVWKVGGMYSPAIEMMVMWLQKATEVAENEKQKAVLLKLIDYYKTGDLKTWDDYNVMWVKDTLSGIDIVNGFIEVYGDPLGRKATYESVVSIRNDEATKRAKLISSNAQWFEDHSPVNPRFKKKVVKGVSAKVITVMVLAGDCYPTTPIGINLPNSSWIRKEHGSKSVTLDNITYSYDQSAVGNGFLEEFCYSTQEREWSEKYGYLAGNLHTDMHECVGHGSGQLLDNVGPDALKNYRSPLEEARADLFALYFIYDKKLVELGVMPNLDVARTEYNNYIRNGLMTQLVRIEPGKNIEQAHMRCRQLVSRWVYEKGLQDKVIEKIVKDGKTYYVINDYNKLRELFGQLLAEVQRIKSEGDYEAGKQLVEAYGVKIDQELHKEVLSRYARLNLSPYGGFLNAILTPVMKDGKIVDIRVEYQDDFVKQNLYYSKKYSFLPVHN
jgi:dipeptidyl-peptidase-3